jgi:hypothetical protein
LSYRAQEIEDPNYDKKNLPVNEARWHLKLFRIEIEFKV